VGARTVLKLTLAPGGGAAVRLSPAGGVQSVADTLPLGVGSLLKLNDFPGTGLISREVQIWLPPGYDAPGAQARHPVLYMHDGQALFEPGRSLPGDEWGVDETLTRLIADGAIRAPIVVGVGNTQERWRDYAPAGVVARLPEALRGTVEAETGGEPKSDAYLRFLTQELKPYIDANYRTLPGPQDTMIMGSSMGGLISLYAAGEYPDVFGGAAALSTHWPLWKPDSMDQVAATLAMTGWLEASGLDPRHQRLWFDHGTLNLDAFYGPYQQVMDRWFVARGFNRAENFSTRVYEGTDHNEASWAARLADPLVFLLGK
jgi:enterochelin esterase-like enzyme